jgi:Uma2 family endonuclease
VTETWPTHEDDAMTNPVAAPPAPNERRLRMTFEEYLAWAPETRQSEWVDGEVIEFMPTKARHADLVSFLVRLISYFVDIRQLGRVYTATFGMRVRAGGPWREPDLMFIATEHLDRITPDRIEGPVDLVVEVVSDDSVTRDRREKPREYAEVGVPEYWIVEGRQGKHGFVAYELHPDGRYVAIDPDETGLIRSKVLPGLVVDPAWLAADPPPNAIAVLRQTVPGLL